MIALSPVSAWAVGGSGDTNSEQPLIEHWDGSTWSEVPSASPGSIIEASAVAIAPNRTGWVEGEMFDDQGFETGNFALHLQCC